jgi:hypothetical protein
VLAGADPLTVAYVSAGAALVGTALGFAGPQLVAWWQKRKRHLAYWSAMSAEIDLCHGLAKAYVADDVPAPLYRLPTIAYDKGFEALLADGAVTEEEAKAILRFYALVVQINRGLDYAHAAPEPGVPVEELDKQVMRLKKKATNLYDPHCKDPGGPYYLRVRPLIDAHLKRRQ